MTAIPLPLLPPVTPPTIAWDVVLVIANLVVGAMAVKAVSDATKDKSDSKPDEAKEDCPPAKVPGKPTAEDGFNPPKRGPGADGKPVRNPNGEGKGWLDDSGRVWVPTGPGPKAHGGPHWDVQLPNGGHTNVYPGGKIR